MLRRRYPWLVLTMLVAAALISVILAIRCGSLSCSLRMIDDTGAWELRSSRVASAFFVGALLSLSGALMQVLLRNPLADPYVLGVSGGAAVGAMTGSLLFPAIAASVVMQLGSLCGALLSVLLLFALSWRSLSGLPATRALPGTSLILTGVMISAGFGAVIALLLSLSSESTLRGMLFWLMGDLDTDSFPSAAAFVLLVAVVWALRLAPDLNVLAHGEAPAQLLGIHVRRLRIALLIIASLATAAAVSVAGTIGFVGLVVPHAIRLWTGNDQRVLLPAALLAGGSGLVLADLVARTVMAPIQLPVGVVTALIGVPVFLYLLNRRRV